MFVKRYVVGIGMLSAALLALVLSPLWARAGEGRRGGGGGGAVRGPSMGAPAARMPASPRGSGAIRSPSSPQIVQPSPQNVQPFSGGRTTNPPGAVAPGMTDGRARTFSGDDWHGGSHHGHDWNDWWWLGFIPGGIYGGWGPGYYGYGYNPYGFYGSPYGFYGGYPYGGYYGGDLYGDDYGTYSAVPSPGEMAAPALAQPSGPIGDFHSQALAAFKRGDHGAAISLGRHAVVDNPRDPTIHLLLAQALSATGDFRGAAMEAHAVAALGPLPDWPTLFGLYGNLQTYTDQRRGLEKFVGSNPSAPEGRFLLGFEYLIEDHKDAAKAELLQAVKLAPRDQLAAQLLEKAGGTVPAEIARRLSVEGADAGKTKAPRAPASLPPPPPKPATDAGGISR